MARRDGLIVVVGVLATIPLGPGVSAMPRPVLQAEVAQRATAIAKCQTGYRKSTVTGLCVRKQVRFPMLSWF